MSPSDYVYVFGTLAATGGIACFAYLLGWRASRRLRNLPTGQNPDGHWPPMPDPWPPPPPAPCYWDQPYPRPISTFTPCVRHGGYPSACPRQLRQLEPGIHYPGVEHGDGADELRKKIAWVLEAPADPGEEAPRDA